MLKRKRKNSYNIIIWKKKSKKQQHLSWDLNPHPCTHTHGPDLLAGVDHMSIWILSTKKFDCENQAPNLMWEKTIQWPYCNDHLFQDNYIVYSTDLYVLSMTFLQSFFMFNITHIDLCPLFRCCLRHTTPWYVNCLGHSGCGLVTPL